MSGLIRARSISINCTNIGDNLIISSNSMPVNIVGLFLVAAQATTIIYKNGTANQLSGPITLLQGGSHNLSQQGVPYFVCGSGTGANGGFYINLNTAGPIGGTLYYTLGGA